MNAFTFLNVALHSLLLSAFGLLVVLGFLRDARHRAWAALLTLIVAMFAPLGMKWPHEAGPKMEKNETSTATTWTPDWKVNVTTQQTFDSRTGSDGSIIAELVLIPSGSCFGTVDRRCRSFLAYGSGYCS